MISEIACAIIAKNVRGKMNKTATFLSSALVLFGIVVFVCGGCSDDKKITDQGENLPKAPSSLKAIGQQGVGVILTWEMEDTNHADLIVVQRNVNGDEFEDIDTLAGTKIEYTDTQVIPQNYYVYRLRASVGTDQSDYSSEITVPEVPGLIFLELDSLVTNRVILSWNDQATVETNYVLERRIGGGVWGNFTQELAANTASCFDTVNLSNEEVTYRVRACNLNGASQGYSFASAEVSTEGLPAKAPTFVGQPRCTYFEGNYWISIDFDYLGPDEEEIASFLVYRRNISSSEPHGLLGQVSASRDTNGLFILEDAQVMPGDSFAYRLRALTNTNCLSDFSEEVVAGCD